MRQTVVAADFDSWRLAARQSLAAGLTPDDIIWSDHLDPQLDLLAEPASSPVVEKTTASLQVPAAFVQLAQKVACHSDSKKWDMLYQALWRLTQREKHLLALASDPLVYNLGIMQKQVSRDAHKAKAFVRFRAIGEKNGRECFAAWHCPDHLILPLVAPFFKRRFGVIDWGILTPQQSVFWDGHKLTYGSGATPDDVPAQDAMEDTWRVFYRAIFNPARIKLRMMRQEMPVRHWKTLPETQIIPAMLREAPTRVADMLRHQEGFASSAAAFIPDSIHLPDLARAAASCQGCPLHCHARQTVFGTGPAQSPLMIVGEQPGEEEDAAGLPFVGPAGQILNQAFEHIGLPRERVYLTNAVKHFKYIIRADKPMHQSPDAREINACKPWLRAEQKSVRPQVMLGLGLTAAKALLGHGFAMKERRGRWQTQAETGTPVMITYHPAAVLRAPASQQAVLFGHLRDDLATAAARAGLLG